MYIKKEFMWFLFAFLTAFFESLKNVFSKKGLQNSDEYIVAWASRFFALPLLFLALFFIKIPSFGSLNNQFWIALLLNSILNTWAFILFMRAIRCSDLSITIPMITFTPLFLLITSPLILGEFPKLLGLIGVLLIVVGSYILNIKESKKGYLAPFRALLKEQGPRLMLVVAFIWSITSNFEKIGVQNSSPIFWAVVFNTTAAIIMFPIMFYKSRDRIKEIQRNIKQLVPVGFSSGLSYIFQMMAINLALVPYVISVKRLSIIITVIFAYFLFKEKGFKERLTGTIIMVLGVILIALA